MDDSQTTFLYGPFVSKRFARTLALDLTATQEHLVVERGSTLARGSVIVTTCARQLITLSKAGEKLDTIIVTGSNVDPAAHPDLREVTENLRTLRGKWFPRAKLCIETAVKDIASDDLRAALAMFDRLFLQFQWGTAKTFAKSTGEKSTQLAELTKRLSGFDHLIIQACFFKGAADNSTESEVSGWIKKLQEVKPQEVHILSGTGGQPKPAKAITPKRMRAIADAVAEQTGLPVALHDHESLLV